MKGRCRISAAVLIRVFKAGVFFDVYRFTRVVPDIFRGLGIEKDYIFRIPVSFSLEVLGVAFNARYVVNETIAPEHIVH